MLRYLAVPILFALPVATATTLASDVAATDVTTPSALTQERAKNSADIRQAMQVVQEARTSYSSGRYTDAVDSYRQALSMLPQSEATAKTKEFIQLSLSDALVAKAMDYREVGRTEEACAFLEEAVKLAPDSGVAKKELAKTLDPVYTNPANSPQHQANIKEVERLLELAYGYYNLGQFDQAKVTFKSVLEIDKYNTAASLGLTQVAQRIAVANNAGRELFRANALTDVSEAFAETIKVLVSDTAPVDAKSEVVNVYEAPAEEIALADFLSNAMVDRVSFDDASMDEAVDVLNGLLRRALDNNPTNEKFGANIITNFGDPNSDIVKSILNRRINLTLSNVSFKDLLTTFCTQLGISYYPTALGVELTYSGKDFGPLITRTFKVPPHFFSLDADEAQESDDPFATTNAVRIKRIDPVAQLKEYGVGFPKNAMAQYKASARSLTVRNTAYNMELIEEALSVPADTEKLVILNVYVMSVDQEVLEDLGFEMLLNFGLGEEVFGGGGSPQTATTASGMPTITSLAGSTADYVSNGLRTGEEVFTADSIDKLLSGQTPSSFTSSEITKSPGIFGFRGVWTAADLTVLMRGLSQSKGVDMIQNPKLVFRPGMEEQVCVAAVREMYYPESYTAPQVQQMDITYAYVMDPEVYENLYGDNDDFDPDDNEIKGSGVIVSPATPDQFTYYGITEDQFTGVGTLLQVHNAEIMNGGQYVKIDISTSVNDFEGFVNWGAPISAVWQVVDSYTASENDDGNITISDVEYSFVSGEISDNPIMMPIFKRAYQNTSVTLAPGSVVVLGGLQESKKVQYEDKIPVLGDLPIIGRLFRSEGQQNKTRVLLFFAKVDLVDPSGIDTSTGKHPEQAPL